MIIIFGGKFDTPTIPGFLKGYSTPNQIGMWKI